MMKNEKLNEHLIKDILAKNYKRVRYILALKADVNTRACGGIGCSALSVAKKIGATDIAKLLEDNGAIDIIPNAEEAEALGRLYFNALSEEEVKSLFLCGGNLEVRNSYGDTPLLRALRYEQFSKAKWLLKYGADVSAVDYEDRNALFYVAGKHGGDFFNELWNEMIEKGANIHQVDYLGNTLLNVAVDEGRFARALDLIKSGVDVNYANKNGETPIYIACFRGTSYLVELLIKNGADINAKDKRNNTPLTISARLGRDASCDIIKMLVEAGANMDAKDEFGDRALDILIDTSSWDSACVLIENGALIDKSNSKRIEYALERDELSDDVKKMIKGALERRDENLKLKNRAKRNVEISVKKMKNWYENVLNNRGGK